MDGCNWFVYIPRRVRHLGLGSNFLLKHPPLASSDWPTMGDSVGRSWVVVSAVHRSQSPKLTHYRHLMTGVGSYFYIVWAIWLRYCMTQSQDKYALRWPSVVFSIPEVVLREELKPAAGSNGHLRATGNSKSDHAKGE